MLLVAIILSVRASVQSSLDASFSYHLSSDWDPSMPCSFSHTVPARYGRYSTARHAPPVSTRVTRPCLGRFDEQSLLVETQDASTEHVETAREREPDSRVSAVHLDVESDDDLDMIGNVDVDTPDLEVHVGEDMQMSETGGVSHTVIHTDRSLVKRLIRSPGHRSNHLDPTRQKDSRRRQSASGAALPHDFSKRRSRDSTSEYGAC